MTAETVPPQPASTTAVARRALTVLAGVAGIALLTGLIIHTGPGRLAVQLRALGPLVPVLLLLTGCRYVLQAAGWRLAIGPAHRPGWWTFISAVIAGEAFGYVTWGPVAREPAKALLLTPGVPGRVALSAAIAERAIVVFAAALLAALGAGLLVARRPLLIWLAAATVALAIGLAIARRLRCDICGVRLQADQSRLKPAPTGGQTVSRLGAAGRFRARVSHWRASAGQGDLWRGRPAALSGIAALAIAQEAITVLEVYLIFTWLGAGPTLTTAIAFAGLSGFLNAAGQFVPGGLGVFEANGALLAEALSLGAGSGVSLALARRARSVIWAAAGALLLVRRGYERAVRPVGGEADVRTPAPIEMQA